jgi:diamine N-acetyltransferase
MPDKVELRDVTARNWRAVVALELAPEQQGLLASNLYSIAQSKFDPDARPRAIYAGEVVVGFLMYDLEQQDDGSYEASITAS